MRLSPIPVLVAGIVLASACTGQQPGPEGTVVVASSYPLAWLAEEIGGDDVTVVNLTPPGVEPHDLELSSDDLATLQSADVVLYLGSGFQPSVETAVASQTGALDLLAGRDLLTDADAATDPHVWLDPEQMRGMAADVRSALDEADPSNAEAFGRNFHETDNALANLDALFEQALEDCESRTLVTAHAAFAYLADAYELEQHPVVIAPDGEPDPAQLADLVALVEMEGVTTVFTETLASPKVAETLALEAGVNTAVLDPLEGLTPEAATRGDDYLSVMRTNLTTLQDALGCQVEA